ncbi:COG2426 family protein [Methanolobus chelungpuianus]|uniref:Ligand-binding protein SH3 n=1 Tax=Methanolobus chelungpuianus TaxID=502115 RepID=A0AAE3KW70_9EURY|nr:small multi-drug export protein [Methanolobus chelungpuianus]MCQ6961987.1 ligand-binding protein SH3 [Methanolobus chelungpuianus]
MSLEAQVLELLSAVPPWLSTIIISCLPIFELRGAIPIALGVYGLSPVRAYMLAVLGNMLPVIPLLLFLDPVSTQLRRYTVFDRFFSWLFNRTRRNHEERFEKYGLLALTLFVAVPLPVTGAWTGCAAAFVFGIKFKHAFPAILAGVMIAGLIVSIVTLTGISLYDLL